MGKKKELEYQFTFNNTTYTVALGGIHSNDKPRLIKPIKDEILIDADIGSQYPNAIAKRELYPSHLGKEWLVGYKDIIQRRIQAKKDKKTNIAEAYKLALNGGGYGKLGEEFNWQYSPENMYKCTIGNQVEILMLIEKLELNGIHIVSANTDGILSLFNKSLLSKYYELCKQWEKTVGNSILGNLEYTEYSLFVQSSVNDYLAVKKDGEIKQKGDFNTEYELHKNKSARIIPLALKAFYTNSTKPDTYIRNHTNIFDFCLGVKSNKGSKLVHFNKSNLEEIELQKINRYIVSTDGLNLLKRMPKLENKKALMQMDIFGNIDDGTRESEVQATHLSTILNKVKSKDIKDYKINYEYYINRVQNIINQIK